MDPQQFLAWRERWIADQMRQIAEQYGGIQNVPDKHFARGNFELRRRGYGDEWATQSDHFPTRNTLHVGEGGESNTYGTVGPADMMTVRLRQYLNRLRSELEREGAHMGGGLLARLGQGM